MWRKQRREGSWGSEIMAQLAPTTGDTVLRKLRFDASTARRLTTG